MDFCLFPDQLLCHIEQLLHCSLWMIFGGQQSLQTIIAQMNCGLLGGQHKRSPDRRIHIDVSISGLAFELSSQIRVDFLKVWYVSTSYAEIVRPLRVFLVVDVQNFSAKLHFAKYLTLARVYSSEFPRTFAQLCIC